MFQLCRIVWGYFYDRFGFKRCIIVIASCVTLGALGLPLLTFLGMISNTNVSFYYFTVIPTRCGQHGRDSPLHNDNDHVLLRPPRHLRGQYRVSDSLNVIIIFAGCDSIHNDSIWS